MVQIVYLVFLPKLLEAEKSHVIKEEDDLEKGEVVQVTIGNVLAGSVGGTVRLRAQILGLCLFFLNVC